jgi:hypothetical protein
MIGRVIGTERRPNTAYTFHFWAKPEEKVGIGTLVKVQGDLVVDGSPVVVYGVVVEAHGYNDLDSPLHEFMTTSSAPEGEPPTERPEIRVYEAAVLRREPEEPIGAVPIGKVSLADEADVQKALRTDGYAAAYGIPAGCYGSRENPLPVHLHAHFLLGPESGHLNMTGTSGLAAKTSFILTLLQSIFARPDVFEGPGEGHGVAALLFNTKGGDLLFLDLPPENELDETDRALYRAMGYEPRPFPQVEYYAPYEQDHNSMRTLRSHPALMPCRPITFGLAEIMDHLEVILSRDDLDAKADSYIAYLKQMFVGKEGPLFREKGLQEPQDAKISPAKTIDDLTTIIDRQLDRGRTKGADRVDGHHLLTVEKVKNRLAGIGSRFRGVLALDGQGEGPLDRPFEAGKVYVIDIAKLSSREQDLVFSAVITKLRNRMEEQTLGVRHLVVMVDELNKYAASGGRDTPIIRSLQDIAARGRYMGLTLFGAQQFRSRVDKEVVGNAATHVFGHIEAEELAQPGYSYFSSAVREKLGSLAPGEVLIKHPHFKQPIFLRFPRPACLAGSDGMRRFPARTVSLADQIVRVACDKGMTAQVVQDLLAECRATEDELHRTLAALLKVGSATEAERVLKRLPRRLDAAAAVNLSKDPFAD